LTSSWRDVLKIHPACELFPPLPQDELLALGESIKLKIGVNIHAKLLQKVAVIERTRCDIPQKEYLVIDGRSRLDAMEAVGIEFLIFEDNGIPNPQIFEIVSRAYEALEFDPVAYVSRANLHRRHLNEEQRPVTHDEMREQVAKALKAQPNLSNRQIAGLIGKSHPTVAKARRELEESGDVEKVSTSTDTKGRQQPVHKPKAVSVKPAPLPTPAQRAEEKIRQAGITDKKKHGELSLARVMDDVVGIADDAELLVLANHHAPERHVRARAECENRGINWDPSSAEQTATERKALYASDDTRDVTISGIRSVDPIQEPCENCETAAEHWQRSAENLAGDAISMRPYWTRQFDAPDEDEMKAAAEHRADLEAIAEHDKAA